MKKITSFLTCNAIVFKLLPYKIYNLSHIYVYIYICFNLNLIF